ncbi:MAG: putative manganese-dependent inorganic diphosphatase [bacterium]|nr:putative manganese-dependent inorganic diphosphatase [bacterium]
MGNILIFGHKKPDTDSVTSSIALAYLKNSLGIKSKAMILDKINDETSFVLNYFNVACPEYLEDVKLQIKDLDYYKNCYVNENSSIHKVFEYLNKKNITGVPVVDNNQKLKGLLTSKIIISELINNNIDKLNTSYDNILETLNGSQILKFDNEIKGNILAASYKSTTILNDLRFDNNTVLIVGDRESIITSAINMGVKLLVIVGNKKISDKNLLLAKENSVNIISTPYDTFHTCKLIGLSNYCKNLIKNLRNVSFNENDYYDDFKKICSKLGFNNFPVVDNNLKCLGLVRITDIKNLNKKQVILVDHNEESQSVEGLEEANILEIIDHHKIGALTTNMPINFRNMTVGSTNTIIYSLFSENHIKIPPHIAGLMLSGIISDTLKFTSPTTTDYDRFISFDLANTAGVDIDSYSNEMFKAGTNLKDKTIKEIIEYDVKTYDYLDSKISISQVITLNSEQIINNKDKYIEYLNEMSKNKDYPLCILCVTDIIKSGSYIFFNENSKNLISDLFTYEGCFINGCLSRKKQLVPMIMNEIR